MPELTSALRDAAGTPVAPLDLADVHSRGRRRRRNVVAGRAAASAALLSVVAVAGFLTLDRDERQVLQPGVPAPTPAESTAPTTMPTVSPSPTFDPRSLDGTRTFQVLSASTDRTLVVDEVDAVPGGCAMQEGSYEANFAACWTDPVEEVRTLSLSPSLRTVEVHPEGDPFTDMPWSQFASYVSGRTGNPDFVYTVWVAKVVDGQVTELSQSL